MSCFWAVLALTRDGTVRLRCVQPVGGCSGGEMTSGRVRSSIIDASRNGQRTLTNDVDPDPAVLHGDFERAGVNHFREFRAQAPAPRAGRSIAIPDIPEVRRTPGSATITYRRLGGMTAR